MALAGQGTGWFRITVPKLGVHAPILRVDLSGCRFMLALSVSRDCRAFGCTVSRLVRYATPDVFTLNT
jgi:hypothetical protein